MGVIYNRPDPTQPAWGESGEQVKPTNADISIGWPATQIPPSRQEFTWLDSQQDKAIRYLCRVGIAQWDQNETYQGFGLAIGSNGSVYWSLQPSQGIDPVFDNGTAWELTNVRLADGDARYVTIAGGMYLTQSQADGRYQLRADMTNFMRFVDGDQRYLLANQTGQFVTFPTGDLRYALRSDLANYETVAHAAATYLRIVDAANTFLTSSGSAQAFLTIADANNRFAQAATNAANDATAKMNNAIATVMAMMPSIQRVDTNNGSTMQGNWYVMTSSSFHFCVGHGLCQQGDQLTPPPGFPQSVMTYRGWVHDIPPSLPSLPAVGGFQFAIDGNGVVAQCFFIRQNDGNTQRGRGFCTGAWVGAGLY